MTVSVMMVDDSSVTLLVMTYILQRDENITICGTAPDGESALILAEKCKPDIITMDLNMPGLNGLEVTRRMLAKRLVPIIIVTTDKTSAANPFSILEAGAVAVLRTPAPPGHPEHEQTASQLIRTIKAFGRNKSRRAADQRHSR